jgi:hypothetical protein
LDILKYRNEMEWNVSNLIPFPSIPPNFGRNENLGFGGKMEECVFHSILSYLNFQPKEKKDSFISIPFPFSYGVCQPLV